jgi:SAM-dependent methyltransferase
MSAIEHTKNATGWAENYAAKPKSYPAENLVRIFKGSYPRLSLDKKYAGKRICDVGCGEGTNLAFLSTLGFQVAGVEISENVVDQARRNLAQMGISTGDLLVGHNASLPFENEYFDYLVSWNTCYYMGDSRDFESHVREYARVLSSGGFFVCSVPKLSCFIYKNSEDLTGGFRKITSDPFGVRNGSVLFSFENEKDIERKFGEYFFDFKFGSIESDCFGYDYHWYLFVAQKK